MIQFKIGLLWLSFWGIVQAIGQSPMPAVQFKGEYKQAGPDSTVIFISAAIPPRDSLLSFISTNDSTSLGSIMVLDSSVSVFIQPHFVSFQKAATLFDPQAQQTVSYFTDSVLWTQTVASKELPPLLKINIQWLCKTVQGYQTGKATVQIQSPNPLGKAQKTNNVSIIHVLLLTLLAGFLSVITPCVFPLLPITVSFFLKRSKTTADGIRNALWYSTSIVLIYVIPTIVLTLIFGNSVLYKISTAPAVNLFFFIIFIVFAVSFLGAFDINLPNKWVNAADTQASKGGLVGIFFMALTLVIVSFSCTGPIVGSLLGQTATQGISWVPIVGMLGFGLGLAIPFSFFAIFPTLLKKLPKSGGWLSSVKIVFGFIELALSLKFLSNVDMAYHWRLLDREVFIAIWLVITLLLGLYLLGKIRFSHDSGVAKHLSLPRLFMALAVFSFFMYLLPGMWGAPRRGISGWLPNSHSQDFNLNELQYKHPAQAAASNSSASPHKYTELFNVPFGLTAYFDLDEGIAAAKKLNKPIMLDFTGHSCSNCRKMEQEVWSNPTVLELIKKEFVLVSLYVDDATPLPIEEQYTNSSGNHITTIGEKNLDYEITKFGFNAQPLYMFLNLKGEPLSTIKYGYEKNIDQFISHLKTVKAAFK